MVTIRSEEKKKIYRIVPSKKDLLQRLLVKLYYPTKSYVLGELQQLGSYNVDVLQNEEVKGECFTHTIDLVFTHERSISMGKDTRSVGVIVLDNVTEHDILALGGRLLDLHDGGQWGNPSWGLRLDGMLHVMVEDGSSQRSFSELEKFLTANRKFLNIQTTAVFVKKKFPREGMEKAQSWAVSILNE